MHYIETDEVETLAETETPIVDLRSAEEFMAGHIPRSINVPVEREDFTETVCRAAPDRAGPIVVYGADGDDTGAWATAMLEQEGYTDVRRYAGGLASWIEAGLYCQPSCP